MIKVIITGDLLPCKDNNELFERGDIDAVFGDRLLELMRSADFRVSNLEGALTDSGKRISKSGPHCKASMKSVIGIRRLGINAVSLSNNHSLDYGAHGLSDTITALAKSGQDGIVWFGGGMNRTEARKPAIIEINGIRVGLYGCAEYEFTIADARKPGANPYDEIDTLDDISVLRESVDYIIVLYHGGKEFFRFPVPYVQRRCREMIKRGADMVICQHSHCIGSEEKYPCNQRVGYILYGQGDFCFIRPNDEHGHSSLLVQITLVKTAEQIEPKIEYIPIVRDGNRIDVAEIKEKQEILEQLAERSELSQNDEFVRRKYDDFCQTLIPYYYGCSGGCMTKIFRKLGLSKVPMRLYRRKDRLDLLNILRCEAHRDVFIRILEEECDCDDF